MRTHIVFSVCAALAVSAACSRSVERRYTLQGQVLAVASDHLQATIKHEEIPGFMAAMTMPYKVKDPGELAGLTPGDLITATLVVANYEGYLVDVRKVGSAPLEKPSGSPAAASGFELLKAGEAVPDAPFVDQDGKARPFSAFKGSTVVLTFIYTHCPLPQFCPLMDRQFQSIQKRVGATAALRDRVHLVTVSFDPANDTPEVLKAHARSLAADPDAWTFLTGDRDAIDRFAARFGVEVIRAQDDPGNITHNLRTAIIDPDGRLVKVYIGNEWTPDQVLADLGPVVQGS